MWRPGLLIARYTLVEALRSRLPWLFVLAAAAAWRWPVSCSSWH